MKPDQTIRSAKAAIDVLELACRHAECRWHWWQINQLAQELMRALSQIEHDESVVQRLRTEARQDRESLFSIAKRSSDGVDKYDREAPVIKL